MSRFPLSHCDPGSPSSSWLGLCNGSACEAWCVWRSCWWVPDLGPTQSIMSLCRPHGSSRRDAFQPLGVGLDAARRAPSRRLAICGGRSWSTRLLSESDGPQWLWLVGCLVASDFVCGPWGGQCILTPGSSVEADRPRPGPKPVARTSGVTAVDVCVALAKIGPHKLVQLVCLQQLPRPPWQSLPSSLWLLCAVGPCAGELL